MNISDISLKSMVIRALPCDIVMDKNIMTLSGDNCNTIKFLKSSPFINWNAYLANYPDVKTAGVDPVEHFIEHGIFEGRNLYSWNPVGINFHTHTAINPKISVIVTNYNNEKYLEKCLFSLLSQTLEDIEIIIVDDASSDASLNVIRAFLNKDARFHLIALDVNCGTHMARKKGVVAAHGDYIMFLDSDDYFYADACEKAYVAICRGYDIVQFKINSINCSDAPSELFQERVGWYNSLSKGEYSGYEKLQLAYTAGKIPHFLWNKIFESGMLKFCFSQMDDGYYILYEDQYEFLLAAYYSRSLAQIEDMLVNYNFGLGITSFNSGLVDVDQLMIHSDIWKPIENFCMNHNLFDILEHEREFLIRCSLEMLEKLSKKEEKFFLGKLYERFGAKFLTKILLGYAPQYLNDLVKFALLK